MTCKEFLKALQDNPDKKLVFEQLVEPTNSNYECRLIKKIENLEIKSNDKELIIESNPFI